MNVIDQHTQHRVAVSSSKLYAGLSFLPMSDGLLL